MKTNKNDPQKNAINALMKNGEFSRPDYHTRHYLLYGGDAEPDTIDSLGTLDYLSGLGYDNNPMKQAREGKQLYDYIQSKFNPAKSGSRFCDFCGSEIYGVEYEELADRRQRCMICSRTVIRTEEEFCKIYADVKRNMEAFYGISIDVPVRVEMVNAKTLHRRLGKAFIPTDNADGRILGVAIRDKKKNSYSLYVENGSPRMPSIMTIAHELTHIWQYTHWNEKAILKKYGKKMRLEIYEGMAKWAEIQYAYLINEKGTAKRAEIETSYRQDEYGYGFLRYHANYPFSYGPYITKITPFNNPEEPLAPEFLGPMDINLPLPGTAGMPGEEDKPGVPSSIIKPSDQDPIAGAKMREPGKNFRYCRELLSDSEKEVYDIIEEAVNDFVPEITLAGAGMSKQDVSRIMDFILADNPGIFWFYKDAKLTVDSDTGAVSELMPAYTMTREDAGKRQQEIDDAVSVFLSAISDSMSDYEVALRVYKNVIELVDYDTIGLEKQKADLSSFGKTDDLRSIYGVFVQKKAVCAGYAKAMQYLLRSFGIDCIYATSESHAWNMIKLEGDWYHLDVTWGDSSNTDASRNKSDRVSYDYFCITTEELLRLPSHKPESEPVLPEATATQCNFYRRHGLFFEKYDDERVNNIITENIASDYKDVSFKCADASVLAEFKRQLVENGGFAKKANLAGIKAKKKIPSGMKYSVSDEVFTIRFMLD